jgi:hypothetical protein
VNSFGASAVNATDSLSVRVFNNQPSVLTALIDLQIGDAALHIPRNYLERAVIVEAGRLYFSFIATLPNFAGANSDTLKCFHSENWSRCDNIVVARPVTFLGESYHKKIAAELENATDTELMFGLKRFRNTPNLIPNFYYVSEEESIAFTCGLPTFPHPRCHSYLDTVGGLTVMYEFSPQRLSQWRDIHIGLRDLFQTFAERS